MTWQVSQQAALVFAIGHALADQLQQVLRIHAAPPVNTEHALH
jgi:hypothetical protein